MKKQFLVLIMALLVSGPFMYSQQPNAIDIIQKADRLLRGQSSYSEMEMTVVRPKWERSIQFKAWSKGDDFSIVYITHPVKEKGQVFLKREREMWNYVPSIERMVKIPPSMMMQSWMGSDLTNDDLINASSIVKDYHHAIIGEERVDGYDCWVIELKPKEDAPVVWGKIVTRISKQGFMTLRNEYYDEDEYLINSETLSDIKTLGGRTLPTRYEIIPQDKPGNKTILIFNTINFDVPIEDSFFSIQNMKKIN